MSTDGTGTVWYFAYGSNMDDGTFRGRRRMRPLASRVARLDGWDLVFDLPIGRGERAVANVARAPAQHVWGVLYELTPAEHARLDRTEGVHRGAYERVPVEVVVGDARLAAFTYHSPRGRAGRKPSARYMGLLLTGARRHGLPGDWLRRLERFELAWDERATGAPAPTTTTATQEELPLMTNGTVKFYFAYNSPYAFLANTRVAAALAPTGVGLEYKPVHQPRTGGAPDFDSPRFSYIFEDVARFAEAYAITPDPGPFADSGAACRGFLYADAQGKGRAYHDGVYTARWLRRGDIGDRDTLAAIAAEAGLAPEGFRAALDDPTWQEALAASNRDAEADGVFGFPFFVWEGKRFWGNDRIEWVVREIQKS